MTSTRDAARLPPAVPRGPKERGTLTMVRAAIGREGGKGGKAEAMLGSGAGGGRAFSPLAH